MRTERKLRLQRFAWYVLVLLLFPLLAVAGWYTYDLFLSELPSLWVVVGASVIISLFVIRILSGQLAAKIPSVYDEEIAKLLRAQERFALLYERSPVPYVTLDRAGKVVMCNLAAIRLFETTINSLDGQDFSQYLLLEDKAALQRLWRDLKNGQTFTDREVQVRAVSGAVRWVLISAFQSQEAKQQLVSLVDITHRKEVDTAKSEFVALATHQLRTPVAAIRWNLELLQRQLPPDLPDTANKYFDKIQRNTLRMIALINDFLNVSKLEMGTFATDLQPIELAKFCDSIIDEFTQAIEQKQLTVTPSYQPVDLTLVSDERLLHIIISNLVSNAVKYIEPNGSIDLRYQLAGNEVLIEVADTGIGIPAAELSELFSKFFRATNAQVQQAEGTGLGLYVVQQSVEKLGGTISVASVENQGTTFSIRLPYKR